MSPQHSYTEQSSVELYTVTRTWKCIACSSRVWEMERPWVNHTTCRPYPGKVRWKKKLPLSQKEENKDLRREFPASLQAYFRALSQEKCPLVARRPAGSVGACLLHRCRKTCLCFSTGVKYWCQIQFPVVSNFHFCPYLVTFPLAFVQLCV